MCADIEAISARILAVAPELPFGFVVGALAKAEANEIDVEAAACFREAAGPRRLTFHRAFDRVQDKRAGLDTLVDLGYQRILTTGGDAGRADIDGLACLVKHAGERIVMLASGGLRSTNVAQVVRATGVQEVHMRAPLTAGTPEGTDPDQVAQIVNTCQLNRA